MKSYLEVSWILSSAALYTSLRLSNGLMHTEYSIRKCMLVSTVLGGLNVLFCESSFFLFVLFYLFGMLSAYGMKLVLCIQSFLWYCGMINVFYGLKDFYSSGWILYVDASSCRWMFVILVLALVCLLSETLLPFFRRSELFTDVTLHFDKYTVECVGFYDTGNQCVVDGLPVVFVSFPFESDCEVEVCGIDGVKKMKSVCGTAVVENRTFDVMIACAQSLQVECLLHSTMK